MQKDLQGIGVFQISLTRPEAKVDHGDGIQVVVPWATLRCFSIATLAASILSPRCCARFCFPISFSPGVTASGR